MCEFFVVVHHDEAAAARFDGVTFVYLAGFCPDTTNPKFGSENGKISRTADWRIAEGEDELLSVMGDCEVALCDKVETESDVAVGVGIRGIIYTDIQQNPASPKNDAYFGLGHLFHSGDSEWSSERAFAGGLQHKKIGCTF